jgi:hypothetical protein
MCWYYTTLRLLYGLEVELIPLPPRHAYSCADALARLNTFSRKLTRLTYLFGAVQLFTALQKMADPRFTGARRLLKRLTPIFCTWTEEDFIPVPKMIKSIDEAVVPPDGSSTNSLGAMKLGYFLCTVKTEDGQDGETMEGVVRVAKYGDPKLPNNPVMVFDLLHDTGCQPCSNRAVSSTLPARPHFILNTMQCGLPFASLLPALVPTFIIANNTC